MSDKEYLQAASMKRLLTDLSSSDYCPAFLPNGERPTQFDNRDDVRHIGLGSVKDELLRRFAALEAERDALKVRLAEAERLLLYANPIIYRMHDHLDGCSHGYPDELWDDGARLVALVDDYAARATQPPTAEGDSHGND